MKIIMKQIMCISFTQYLRICIYSAAKCLLHIEINKYAVLKSARVQVHT